MFHKITFIQDGQDSWLAKIVLSKSDTLSHADCTFTGIGTTSLEAYNSLVGAIGGMSVALKLLNEHVLTTMKPLWGEIMALHAQQVCALYSFPVEASQLKSPLLNP